MPVSNFFETSNYHPRYHSNCRIVRPLTGIYQFLCLNAAFTESVYSAFCLSGFRLRSDKSLEVCLRFSPATGSLCASFPDRLRHRLSSLHSSTWRGACQSFFWNGGRFLVPWMKKLWIAINFNPWNEEPSQCHLASIAYTVPCHNHRR